MVKRKTGWTTRKIVLLGLLGALIFGSKIVMALLPNIEPVSLLVIVYTLEFGWYALCPIYIYVLLEYSIWGISYWSISYLYIWAFLALLTMLLRRMESPLGWAVLSGAFGLSFGALCAIVQFLIGGWTYALTWWVSGLPFDIAHCVGNFVMAMVLLTPLRKLLSRLSVGFF